MTDEEALVEAVLNTRAEDLRSEPVRLLRVRVGKERLDRECPEWESQHYQLVREEVRATHRRIRLSQRIEAAGVEIWGTRGLYAEHHDRAEQELREAGEIK